MTEINERMIIQSGENIRAVISLMMAHETNLRSHLRRNVFDFQFLLRDDVSSNDLSLNELNLNTDSSLNVTYSTYEELEEHRETSCPITHEPFLNDDEIAIINTCKHYFKKDAFLTWTSHSHTCPVCRTPT
uniref:RING-type domain-containing protein n=1 Tax=viral metagenome TaxID=1070528 RepID=A0A6C0ETE6_9ZZZZ